VYREHLFGLTPDFRQVLMEIGWPDAGKAEPMAQFVSPSPKEKRKTQKMRQRLGRRSLDYSFNGMATSRRHAVFVTRYSDRFKPIEISLPSPLPMRSARLALA
jgi:hypothetical protein